MNETKAVLPFKINIASPCHARWEDMGGDDRVRFCDRCRKNVYNLSAMSNAEAVGLLKEKNGNLCARFYRRGDGTVLTEDCPVGLARYWRKIKLVTASVAALFLFAMANLASFARGGDSSGTNGLDKNAIGTNRMTIHKIKESPMLMGKICVRPGTNSTSLPQHLMGEPVMGAPAVLATPSKGASVQTNVPIWLMGDVAQTTMKGLARQAQSTNSPSKK